MWPNPQFPADLVTITVEILNGKLHLLCSDIIIPDIKHLRCLMSQFIIFGCLWLDLIFTIFSIIFLQKGSILNFQYFRDSGVISKKYVIKSTAQKMKFSMKDLFSKCDQIRRKLRIWSHLLKKSLMEKFIFCAVKF